MITAAEIKLLHSLRDKKFRDEFGFFIVEGEKMVREALESGFEVKGVWRREDIGDRAMDRISQMNTPSPCLALVRKPLPEDFWECRGLNLALDGIRDPGNMGTILRLCDWFGVESVFLSDDCVDIYNFKVVQATMGAVFRLKTVRADIPSVCKKFRKAGVSVYGTFLDGESIYGTELREDALVIMGNESDGISPAVAGVVDARLLIPSFAKGPTAESLNVAAATAVTLSEFRRRKV